MDVFNSYQQTLDFLYQRLPMFSHIGAAAYKKDLGNTVALCKALGNPQHTFKSVHIAGTNGKGSVSHMLAAVFQQAGYKTGLYTSPHLLDFRERIRINGQMVDEAFVLDFINRMRPHIEKINPSFFEITVAMAFDYFARLKVDIAIIEVGLGGRFDSTNVIKPELSIITNISYDHQAILGNTLPEIASEKAGIIKEDIPVIIGETHPETGEIFIREAKERQAPIYFADQQRAIISGEYTVNHLQLTVNDRETEQRYWLDLNGQYQGKNLLTLLSAIRVLQRQGWKLTDAGVRESLQHVKRLTGLRGRWDIIAENPLVILDVAHNEGGIRQITAQLAQIQYSRLHIVMGFVKDKDINRMLDLLPKEAAYYYCKAGIPRALDDGELAILGIRKGLHGENYPSVKAALTAALKFAGKDDMVLVCGSFFIVGEALGAVTNLIAEKHKTG